MTSKKQHPIEVINYDSKWPELFQSEAKLLIPIFSKNFVAIHHIGSTAVPGLAAKPTIDILIEVRDIEIVDICNQSLAEIGYEAWGEYGIKRRRFFLKGKEKRTHHLHVFQTGSPEVMRHIYLRDYLIKHPDIAKQYAKLKKDLAEKFSHDRRNYVLGKQDFVKQIESQAILWAKDHNYH